MKKIALLINGPAPELCARLYQDYGNLFVSLFAVHNSANHVQFEWSKYFCFQDEFPAQEEESLFDGFILTGYYFEDCAMICHLLWRFPF